MYMSFTFIIQFEYQIKNKKIALIEPGKRKQLKLDGSNNTV